MKTYSFALLTIAAVGSSAMASTVREHTVAELHKSSKEAVATFAGDLSFALNELRRCPDDVKAQLDFGNQIIAVTYTDDRTQVRTSTITANGAYPAPSFQPFQVVLKVSSKPVKETTPPPADAPGKRKYTCSVKKAEAPQR